MVGGSKFYEMMESAVRSDVSIPSPTEKQDHMKPTDSEDDECEDIYINYHTSMPTNIISLKVTLRFQG